MESRANIPVGPPVSDPLPSYWHNPKSPLANLIEPEPSTATKPYDYAIIGSGISGTLIAYNLLKSASNPKPRIVMLEAREACGGATGRNGGHTKAASYRTYLQHREELGKAEALRIARLEYSNILETHRIAKDLGIECESQKCNTVDLIYDRETFEAGTKAIEMLKADVNEEETKVGRMAWYKIHSVPDAISKFYAADKNVNTQVEGEEKLEGAFEYLAGRINAYRFSTGILNECTKMGLQVCTNTPVHDILPSSSTTSTPSYDIFTQYTTICAHSVILATNGYTPYLLSSLRGSIVPLRGQVTAQKPGANTTLPTPLPTTYSFIYKSGYEYMIPRPLPSGDGQHIVIGGGLGREPEAGASEYGTVDDSSLNTHISPYLRGSLVGYFGPSNWGEEVNSAESDERVVQEWTGIMGATADGRPFVGEVPGMKGLWLSAGFNGHGMVLCLKSAQALVERMGSGEWPEWFPTSFEISEERLKSKFAGRTDMRVPETRGKAVEKE